MSDHDPQNPGTGPGDPDDWLVRLVRAPAGAVLLDRGGAPDQPPPLPAAEADSTKAAPPLAAAEAPTPEAMQPPPLPASDVSGPADAAPDAPAAEPPDLPAEAGRPGGATPPASDSPPAPDTGPTPAGDSAETVLDLAVETIHPNPDQPRRTFDPDELAALAASIAEQGVIQPVVVRPSPADPGQYQLVVGERRWRAARLAGLARLPAVLRSLDDSQTAEIALVENIQRADLPPMEEARAYAQLIERHGRSQDDLARRLGKNRSHIGHMLRLLRLPEAVQRMIADGAISVGHARLLVSVSDPQALADRIVAEGLSVRQTETAAKSGRADAVPDEPKPTHVPVVQDRETWATRFRSALDRPVQVNAGRNGGSVVIRYDTEDDLAAILARMGG